jgi:hypothetical protein
MDSRYAQQIQIQAMADVIKGIPQILEKINSIDNTTLAGEVARLSGLTTELVVRVEMIQKQNAEENKRLHEELTKEFNRLRVDVINRIPPIQRGARNGT